MPNTISVMIIFANSSFSAAEKSAWLKLASNAGPSVGTNPVTALNTRPIIKKKIN